MFGGKETQTDGLRDAESRADKNRASLSDRLLSPFTKHAQKSSAAEFLCNFFPFENLRVVGGKKIAQTCPH